MREVKRTHQALHLATVGPETSTPEGAITADCGDLRNVDDDVDVVSEGAVAGIWISGFAEEDPGFLAADEVDEVLAGAIRRALVLLLPVLEQLPLLLEPRENTTRNLQFPTKHVPNTLGGYYSSASQA